MASKLFRCYRCNAPFGRTFTADRPECPDCGAAPPAVLRLVLVHWLAPSADGPLRGLSGDRYRLACDPGRATLAGVPASPQPDAVTCPQCRAAAGHRSALEGHLEANGATLADHYARGNNDAV